MDYLEINAEEIKSKGIALVVHNAEDEDDIQVCLGRLLLTDGEGYFINEERGWKISLNSEQLNRLKPISEPLKSVLLNADYAISMVIQSLPHSDIKGYKKTGMKWHK
jgi:hypothetical protein